MKLFQKLCLISAHGHSVAISGRHAIVGAYGDGQADSNAGAAYIYDMENLAKKPLIDLMKQSEFGNPSDCSLTLKWADADADDNAMISFYYDTDAAMGILVPDIGEIIGGSQREERLEVLEARMEEQGLSKEDYWWYLDSRGSVPHSGFGLGFERMMMLVTGITNIRDAIPFPRTPKHIDF
jgi:hypothetical protein